MKYFFIILFYPLFLFAQSEYLNKGQFGFIADAAYSQNDKFSGTGSDFGVSIAGRLDVGIQFSSGSYDIEYSDVDIESKGYLFYTSFNIKRSNSSSNIKLMFGYLSNSIESSSFTPLDISGLIVGLGFSFRVYDNKYIMVIPGLDITYGFLSVTHQRYNSYSLSDDSYLDDSRNLSFAFDIVPKLSENIFLVISPSLSKDLQNSNDSIIFGIRGGLVFSTTADLIDD